MSRIKSIMHVRIFEMKSSCLYEFVNAKSLEHESLEAESLDVELMSTESIDARRTKDRRDSMLMIRHE